MTKGFWNSFIRDRSGQSLMEIIVGLSIGAILIGTASFGISFMLRSTTTNQNLSTASQLTQGLLSNIQSFSNSSWQNVYGLSKGFGNQYFLNASGTLYFTVQGQEGVISNDIKNGLIGKWGFDEVAGPVVYDATGNNNNGTLTNLPTHATSTCKISNCLSFDGENDYVNVPNLTISGNAATFSTWANFTDFLSLRDLVKNVSNSGSGQFYILINKTNSKLDANFAGNTSESSASIITNTWVHLAATYDGSNIKIYINGILDSSTPISNNAFNFTGINIGAQSNGISEFMKGSLDDVRIYNRALSASEVQQLYNSQAFTRYFYVENVCRTNDASGNISSSTPPCSGGLVDDPLTQKVTAVTNWLVGVSPDQVSLTRYITRWGNFSIRQSDWSGGSGQDGSITIPNNQYSSSTNITPTSTFGSFKILNLTQ